MITLNNPSTVSFKAIPITQLADIMDKNNLKLQISVRNVLDRDTLEDKKYFEGKLQTKEGEDLVVTYKNGDCSYRDFLDAAYPTISEEAPSKIMEYISRDLFPGYSINVKDDNAHDYKGRFITTV